MLPHERESLDSRAAWIHTSAMAMTPDEIGRYVDAAARALALTIAPEHRAGVLGYFALAASLAAIVEAQPIDLHEEPAAVFVPVSPIDAGEAPR